jgi:hypothetical protein
MTAAPAPAERVPADAATATGVVTAALALARSVAEREQAGAALDGASLDAVGLLLSDALDICEGRLSLQRAAEVFTESAKTLLLDVRQPGHWAWPVQRQLAEVFIRSGGFSSSALRSFASIRAELEAVADGGEWSNIGAGFDPPLLPIPDVPTIELADDDDAELAEALPDDDELADDDELPHAEVTPPADTIASMRRRITEPPGGGYDPLRGSALGSSLSAALS